MVLDPQALVAVMAAVPGARMLQLPAECFSRQCVALNGAVALDCHLLSNVEREMLDQCGIMGNARWQCYVW